MIISYPAIFVEEKVGGFSVIFPDLNHLATCGDDLDEAIFMAIDCLAGYIYSEKIDGNKIPPPTPIEKSILKRKIWTRKMILKLFAYSQKIFLLMLTLMPKKISSITKRTKKKFFSTLKGDFSWNLI